MHGARIEAKLENYLGNAPAFFYPRDCHFKSGKPPNSFPHKPGKPDSLSLPDGSLRAPTV
jgi:hypothetical protein